MNLEPQHDHTRHAKKFSNAILEQFKKIAGNPKFNNDISWEKYCESNLYFVTVMFHLDRVKWKKHPDRLIAEFGRYYFAAMKAHFGNNLIRKKHIQPIVYVFLDSEGTRHQHRIDFSKASLPHLHGLALVKPKTEDVFAKINDGKLIPPDIPSIKKIEFTPYRSEKSPEERMISYAMKASNLVDRDQAGAEDGWNIFPG